MSIRNQPTGNSSYVEFIRSWRPQGSDTIFSVRNIANGMMYYLLKWGNEIYLPVGEGDHICLQMYNQRAIYVAYPGYAEALPFYDNGVSEPEGCTSDMMWECRPWDKMEISGLHNPYTQRQRDFIVRDSNDGLGIGVNSFGSSQWDGHFRVYERLQLDGGQHQAPRPTNAGYAQQESLSFGGGKGGPQMYETPLRRRSSPSRSAESAPPSPAPSSERGHAQIALGAEHHHASYATGITYQRNAQPVIFLRTEFRSDLQTMLRQAWGAQWDWFWPQPTISKWWDEPWTWRASAQTASQVPVARIPHTGRKR